MTRFAGILLVVLFALLASCVGGPGTTADRSGQHLATAGSAGGTGRVDQYIASAGITDWNVKRDLKKYFNSMPRDKAFALNPFDKSKYYYAYGFGSSTEAKSKALRDSSVVLFAINNRFVWEKEIKKYLNTPIGRGEEFFSNMEYEEAVREYEEAPQRGRSGWYVLNRLGWCNFYLHQYNLAIEHFNKSLRKKKKVASYSGLISSFLRNNQDTEARHAFEEFKKKIPDSNDKRFFLAAYYASFGEYKNAYAVSKRNPLLGFEYNKRTNTVLNVFSGSPADLGGLREGDVVLEFNRVRLKGKKEGTLSNLVKAKPYGSTITLTVQRDGVVYKGEFFNGMARNLPERAARLKKLAPVQP